MSPKQKKIAAKAPPPNKIDEKDFAVLRAEKAKGRGMGLQDEKVKPGKVMKAKRGTGVLAEKGKSNTFSGYSKPFEGPQHKGRVATIAGVKPNSKIKKGIKSASKSLVGKAGRVGAVGAALAATAVGAKKLIDKIKEKKNKKMGGGMMNKPMGYTLGGAGKASTGKKDLQRKSPTRGQAAARQKKNKLSLGQTQYKTYTKELDTQFDKAERLQKNYKGASPTIKANLEKKFRKSPLFRTNEIVSSSRRDASKTFLNVGGMMEDRKRERRKLQRAEIIKKITGVRPGSMVKDAKKIAEKIKSSKRMGGGMMQKPMGYKKGVMVMARGCKLGRKKATKIT